MRLSLRCVSFSLRAFWHAVREASGLPEDADSDQVKYLISYLASKEVEARTLIVEDPYVDRHHFEEYTGYYASGLRPGRLSSSRLARAPDVRRAAIVTTGIAARAVCKRGTVGGPTVSEAARSVHSPG